MLFYFSSIDTVTDIDIILGYKQRERERERGREGGREGERERERVRERACVCMFVCGHELCHGAEG